MAARGTAVVIFASMFLVCFAYPPEVKEKVKEMKAQLLDTMKFLATEKAKFETERNTILQVQQSNMAKLECLRKIPTVTAAELKAVETQTLTTTAHLKKSFMDMEARIKGLESMWEVMSMEVKRAEQMVQQDPGYTVASM